MNIDETKKMIETATLNCYMILAVHFGVTLDEEFKKNLVVCYYNYEDLAVQNNSNTDLYFDAFTVGINYNVKIKKCTDSHQIILTSIEDTFRHLSLLHESDIQSLSSRTTKRKLIDEINKTIQEKLNAFVGGTINVVLELSNTKYERRDCNANIVFINQKTQDYKLLIDFSSSSQTAKISFDIEHTNIIRKLLEIATGNIALLVTCDEEEGNIVRGYTNYKPENQINVKVLAPYHITISEGESLLSEFRNNRYFYRPQYSVDCKYEEKIKNFFDDPFKSKYVLNYINRISSDKSFHGALIVFSDDNEFINRMNRHLRAIKPKKSAKTNLFKCFDKKEEELMGLLVNLSCIDGAVIFNTDGNLALFGTILDGISRHIGLRERGSRYNSAKTFVEYYSEVKNQRCLAIIMSVDHSIEIICS